MKKSLLLTVAAMALLASPALAKPKIAAPAALAPPADMSATTTTTTTTTTDQVVNKIAAAMDTSASAAPASKLASLIGNGGQPIGTATIIEIPGGVFVQAEVKDLLPGWHAFHIHNAGDCTDLASFKTAGGHLMHGVQMHGVMSGKGPHAGDLPNIWVGRDGTGKAQFFSTFVTFADLSGPGGSSFIVHGGADDYKTDPSGASGTRVACGVIVPGKMVEMVPGNVAPVAPAPVVAPVAQPTPPTAPAPAPAAEPHSAF